jgi:hypothetical protein
MVYKKTSLVTTTIITHNFPNVKEKQKNMTQEQHTTLVVSLHIYGDDEAQKKQKENWRYVWVVKLPLQAPYSTWVLGGYQCMKYFKILVRFICFIKCLGFFFSAVVLVTTYLFTMLMGHCFNIQLQTLARVKRGRRRGS